jgi:hypothetical protein
MILQTLTCLLATSRSLVIITKSKNFHLNCKINKINNTVQKLQILSIITIECFSLGTKWISIIVVWYVRTINDTHILPGPQTATDSQVIFNVFTSHCTFLKSCFKFMSFVRFLTSCDWLLKLVHVIQKAQSFNFSIMLKPHIDILGLFINIHRTLCFVFVLSICYFEKVLFP